jgi:hypothetical protein
MTVDPRPLARAAAYVVAAGLTLAALAWLTYRSVTR